MGIKGFHEIPINANKSCIRSMYRCIDSLSCFNEIAIDASYILYKFVTSIYTKDCELDPYRYYFYDRLLLFFDRLISYNIKIIVVFDGYNSIKYNTNVDRLIKQDKFITKYIMQLLPECIDPNKITLVEKKCDDSIITVYYNEDNYNYTVYKLNNPYPCREDRRLLVQLLNLLEIPHLTTDEAEAEQIAVRICKNVLSHDTDVLMLGGVLITMCDEIGRVYKYLDGQQIIKTLKLSMNDYLKMCIVLGCDFCEKTKNVGPKKVISMLNSIKLTDAQLNILHYIQTINIITVNCKPKIPSKDSIIILNEISSLCNFNFNRLYSNVRF